MNKIFDSHAHYDDAAFDSDRKMVLDTFLPQSGVCGLIDCGASLESSRKALLLAQKYSYIYAAIGLHPEEVKEAPENWLTELEQMLKKKNSKLIAIGEIGLDYHFAENASREDQKKAFIAQLELAKRYDLPVIIHDREAHGDTMEILRRYHPRGVMHCFSGSVEMMRELVKIGMYVGLGGAVTFKNARVPVAVAAAVPSDRLLTETDCPYMAPVPFRGKRCDSTMIPKSAAVIAQARSCTTQEVLQLGIENACKLFHISL
jgi:TatD DNase family protein